MSNIVFDVDGPLVCLQIEYEFFIWANGLDEVVVKWDYGFFVETGDWQKATKLSPASIDLLYNRFARSDSYPEMRPTPGSRLAIRSLSGSTRYIATSRGLDVKDKTTRFLDEHFGRFAGYHFNTNGRKAAVIRKVSATAIIDDNLRELKEVSRESNARTILFPSRAPRSIPCPNGIVVLEAEKRVRKDMSVAEYDKICSQAWLEIVSLINSN